MTRRTTQPSGKSASGRGRTIVTGEASERTTGTIDPRTIPAVDPAFMTLNHEGFGWRQWMVRLPAGAIADDLKEPGIWNRVQSSGQALRRHDHLYIVAFDETWCAEAIVADSSNREVSISKPRLTSLEIRGRRLFQDDTYRVKWYGNGFAVERRADGLRMSELVPNEALAERALAKLYPVAGGS